MNKLIMEVYPIGDCFYYFVKYEDTIVSRSGGYETFEETLSDAMKAVERFNKTLKV